MKSAAAYDLLKSYFPMGDVLLRSLADRTTNTTGFLFRLDPVIFNRRLIDQAAAALREKYAVTVTEEGCENQCVSFTPLDGIDHNDLRVDARLFNARLAIAFLSPEDAGRQGGIHHRKVGKILRSHIRGGGPGKSRVRATALVGLIQNLEIEDQWSLQRGMNFSSWGEEQTQSDGEGLPLDQFVLTPFGERMVGALRPGDKVISYDSETGDFTESRIKAMQYYDGLVSGKGEVQLNAMPVPNGEGNIQSICYATSGFSYYSASAGRFVKLEEITDEHHFKGCNVDELSQSHAALVRQLESVPRILRKVVNPVLEGGPNSLISECAVLHPPLIRKI